jgi:hypothetical protein
MRNFHAACGLAILTVTSTFADAGPRLGYPACKDKAVMSRAIELSDEGDYQAARAIIDRGMKSRDCQLISADRLVIEVTPPLSRVVKVHKMGDPDEYWIIN